MLPVGFPKTANRGLGCASFTSGHHLATHFHDRLHVLRAGNASLYKTANSTIFLVCRPRLAALPNA
jgi:hypothetical protein